MSVLKEAVSNDYDYRLLSNDQPIDIKYLKTMDATTKEKQVGRVRLELT